MLLLVGLQASTASAISFSHLSKGEMPIITRRLLPGLIAQEINFLSPQSCSFKVPWLMRGEKPLSDAKVTLACCNMANTVLVNLVKRIPDITWFSSISTFINELVKQYGQHKGLLTKNSKIIVAFSTSLLALVQIKIWMNGTRKKRQDARRISRNLPEGVFA